VTAGDVNGNGTNDLVVSEDAGGQPLVQVYQVSGNQLKMVTSFLAFGSSMTFGRSDSHGRYHQERHR